MTRLGWIVIGIVVFAVAITATALAFHSKYRTAPVPTTAISTTTPEVDPSALAIYTNGEYGFALFYPATGSVADAFAATTTAGLPWRLGATATGTSVVSIRVPGQGEVRVGVSDTARELASCTEEGPAEETLSTLSMGSTTWSRFSFQKLGTDDEEDVVSYRIARDGRCYALETLEPIEDEAASTTPAYTLADVAKSFTFAK